jgi:glutathione S-transferase
MKVFHAPGSRSMRVLWAVEEMGLTCEAVPASFLKPEPEFLAVNPSRTLPAFVDEDVVITESVAILMYLATAKGPTPLWVADSEPDYPTFLQFLVFGEAGLAAPMNAIIGTRFMAPDDQKQNFTVGIIEEGFLRRLALLEARLEGREFIAADRFTVADISVAYALLLAGDFLKLGDRFPPRTVAYFERMKARPAFQRAGAR